MGATWPTRVSQEDSWPPPQLAIFVITYLFIATEKIHRVTAALGGVALAWPYIWLRYYAAF